ncbi:MAG: ATP-binding protein, partial [Bacteroidota bacterium]|nr:ATP-binding protein [Bacteroidota bacterium]
FRESLSKHPDMRISAEVYGNWLKEDAERELLKMKDNLLNADLVFAQNDVMALGTYRVCKELGIEKKVKILGVDGQPGPGSGLELVSNKLITATMLYPTGGEEAIRTAFKILNGESFNKQNILQTLVIDSTNVRLMQLQSAKIDEQQSDIEKQQALLTEQRTIYKGQTTFLYVTITALVLALLLGVIVLFAWRNNRKINKRLSASNAEISNQKNQLVEMTAKAKVATDAKFNFFTNISHELRTPLTLILAPLEDALGHAKLHFAVKNNLEIIQKNALRLLRLVNQLMDFRKIEHNKMKLRASQNNLSHFVTDIVGSFREMAKKKSITLQVYSRVNELPVWFDVNMMDKVLFNLLSNAFKFTKEEGFVTVSTGKSGDGKQAMIIVEDTGVGMTPEAKEHAFDLFYQERGTMYKGSGLGLSLSKELIALHHGSIEVESEKWKGTRFSIYLPLGCSHFEADEMIEEAVADTEVYEDLTIYGSDTISPKYEEKDAALIHKEHSVLLIEDNSDLLNFLKYRLQQNFDVYEAETGIAGLMLAHEVVPDLIVCDVNLPGKDGFSITQTLKQDIRSSHIPIVILTASGSIEKQIASLQVTADAFITKPFNLTHLEETIKSLLKSRKQLREHYTSEASYEQRNGTSKIDRKFINEFTAIVEKNIANDAFSIEEICKETHVSRIQLSRKIKALLGIHVNDYILNARLQKAKYLLLHEDLTIAEVAYKVGFASQAYFATVFKSKVLVTPSEFKEKTKG